MSTYGPPTKNTVHWTSYRRVIVTSYVLAEASEMLDYNGRAFIPDTLSVSIQKGSKDSNGIHRVRIEGNSLYGDMNEYNTILRYGVQYEDMMEKVVEDFSSLEFRPAPSWVRELLAETGEGL